MDPYTVTAGETNPGARPRMATTKRSGEGQLMRR
jgi:hypothetical protein